MIPFNKPYFSEECLSNIRQTYEYGIQSGDGVFSKKIYSILNEKFGFKNSLLVPSCTHALEMMAILLNLKEDDEIIIPSYTFVSTANAFVTFGCKVIFVDSKENDPNIDVEKIEECINSKTKAICLVHYAGFSCDIDSALDLCNKYNIFLLEDAAQAINSFYKNKPLGSFGIMSAFSFHETKNINCGEGGLLVINDSKYMHRAEIIREKGTNRSSFFKGEINKYEWVDKGSSYLLSEINSAYLYPQILDIDNITLHRKNLWEKYYVNLKIYDNINFKICKINDNCISNYHIFYILLFDDLILNNFKEYMKINNVNITTHYIPLHMSKYYLSNNNYKKLDNCEKISKSLVRFPLYNDLTIKDVDNISKYVIDFFNL